MIQHIYSFEYQRENGYYVEESIVLDTDHMLFYLERMKIDNEGQESFSKETISTAHVQVILQAAALNRK